jgi:hypothetical protein
MWATVTFCCQEGLCFMKIFTSVTVLHPRFKCRSNSNFEHWVKDELPPVECDAVSQVNGCSDLEENPTAAAAGIAQLATGWTDGLWFPAGARNVSFLHSVQTGSESYAASSMAFSGSKAVGAWSWPLPSSTKEKNCGTILPLPRTPYGMVLN